MRYLLGLIVILAGASVNLMPAGTHGQSWHGLSRLDRANIAAASRLAGQSPTRSIRWLHKQLPVQAASLGADGETIDVRFHDGGEIAILPRRIVKTHLTLPRTLLSSRPHLIDASHRAVVLEPFANDLNLGPTGGQDEVDLLTQAGFSVDIFRNADVTVPVMHQLSNYSVVYIETHSGVLANGDAIVATGETNAGPYRSLMQDCLQAEPDDCSVKQAIAAGDTQLYNAITGVFVQRHMATFPNSSLIFLNGCSMLSAPRFWQSLRNKNVSAMISWDREVYNTVNELTGLFVVQDLQKGDTVAASVQDVVDRGYGVSVVRQPDGTQTTAHLGFLGDGSDGFNRALAGTPPAPTATPKPTAKPKPTPRATPKPKKHKPCKRGYKRVKGKCKPCKNHRCKKR